MIAPAPVPDHVLGRVYFTRGHDGPVECCLDVSVRRGEKSETVFVRGSAEEIKRWVVTFLDANARTSVFEALVAVERQIADGLARYYSRDFSHKQGVADGRSGQKPDQSVRAV